VSDAIVRRVDIEAVARQWQLPVEIALDLVSLALYDIVIYADDSYSMQGENWDSDLNTIIKKTAGVATMFDEDGISVRFMNGKNDKDHIRSAQDVMALFQSAKPCGLTPIGTSLKLKVLEPYMGAIRAQSHNRTSIKPMLVMTITDGEPQGEPRETLFNVIAETRQTLVSMGFTGNEVALQFAQVGDDSKAEAFLDSLDNHPQIGRFVDATSNYEREADQWARRSGGASQMSPDLYMVKLLCGAVDNEWDMKDESNAPAAPSQQQGHYPPQQPGYPPQQPGYPPQQPGYPPQQPGYPPQQPGYPPQPSAPPQHQQGQQQFPPPGWRPH